MTSYRVKGSRLVWYMSMMASPVLIVTVAGPSEPVVGAVAGSSCTVTPLRSQVTRAAAVAAGKRSLMVTWHTPGHSCEWAKERVSGV